MQPLFDDLLYFPITSLAICITEPFCILIKYMPFARLPTSNSWYYLLH